MASTSQFTLRAELLATCQPIVHINGWPGTGKLTIAKKLVSLLNSDEMRSRISPHLNARTAAKLVHNHLLINPADAVLDRTQDGYEKLRQAIRRTVFDTLTEERATFGTTYVFTDFQSANELGAAHCQEYLDCALARGATFVPVVLHCNESTNLQRLQSEGRSGEGKLVDAALLQHFRREESLHTFDKSGMKVLTLDVTELSPEEAAGKIFKFIVECCLGRTNRSSRLSRLESMGLVKVI